MNRRQRRSRRRRNEQRRWRRRNERKKSSFVRAQATESQLRTAASRNLLEILFARRHFALFIDGDSRCSRDAYIMFEPRPRERNIDYLCSNGISRLLLHKLWMRVLPERYIQTRQWMVVCVTHAVNVCNDGQQNKIDSSQMDFPMHFKGSSCSA